MSDLVNPAPRAWHVLFMSYPEKSWWDRFLRPGFQHVLLLGWSEARQLWTCVEPRRTRIEITTWTKDETVAMLAGFRTLGREITAALVVPQAAPPSDRAFHWRARVPPMTCATVAAYLLGLDLGASTPHGLYRELLRMGAEPSPLSEIAS